MNNTVDFNSQFFACALRYQNSDSGAFCINDVCYTYREFYSIVSQLVDMFRCVKADYCCLYAIDDVRTYASIVALWILGKAYVPLNPMQPAERHLSVFSKIDSDYIISAENNYTLDGDGICVLRTSSVAPCSVLNNIIPETVSDKKDAYVIFTSGSTGEPKGVPVSRGNLAAFIDSMNNIGLDINSSDKCLQPFDLTFDFSVSSYVIPLVNGACTYTIPNKALKYLRIASLVEDYRLTVLQMVPSMMRNLLPYIDEIDLSCIRYNVFCGEALTASTLAKWHANYPDMISFNMYGPTEDTVFCTQYRIDKSNIGTILAANDIISIGKTFNNNICILADEDGSLITACGKEGELCLAGGQLTAGYWKNSEENSRRFFYLDGNRFYRSGDLCYWNESGNLMYVCRKDFQVKINGFRVELGEIETTYSKNSGGRYCVVVPYLNEQGNTELAIAIEGKEYDYSADKEYLISHLPKYEVPSKWCFVRSIPLNQNGKVDRKELIRRLGLQ